MDNSVGAVTLMAEAGATTVTAAATQPAPKSVVNKSGGDHDGAVLESMSSSTGNVGGATLFMIQEGVCEVLRIGNDGMLTQVLNCTAQWYSFRWFANLMPPETKIAASLDGIRWEKRSVR
jgi:hypothetical protein